MVRKRKIWIILAVIVLLGASLAFYFGNNRKKLIEVQTGKVNLQKLISRVTASGTIQPKKKVDISASIAGKIVRLAVEEGDRVKEGDFLLQIDPAPYQAAVANSRAALSGALSELESAKANLKQAEQTFERKAQIWQEGSGLISREEFERSKTDVDVLRARVSSAQHQVEQARANLASTADDLSKTTVTAPMTGIVVRKAVEEGEVAVIGTMNNPGTVLLTVADLSVMEAELEVDETDIGSLEIGQYAIVTVDAFPNREFKGTVTEIGNSPIIKATGTNQESTDFKVTVTLDNPDPRLRPGLTADGNIVTATCEDCITVPIQSLVIRNIGDEKLKLPKEKTEKEGVFVVKSSKAVFTPIETGIMGEMDIQVKSGLKKDQEIVTGSYQTLRELKDGDGIQIKKEEKGKDGKRGN